MSKRRDNREPPIEDQDYYHGLLPREDLPVLLTENGDFLVRSSEPDPEQPRQIILSMMYEKGAATEMKHFVVQKTGRKYKIDALVFKSVHELVEHHLKHKTPLSDLSPKSIIRRAIARQGWELNHADIETTKKLGEGAFGEVHAGKLRLKTKRQVDVAIKIAKNDKMTKDTIKEFMKEARLMRNYEHPNVVRLYGVAIEREPMMIVMELVNGGALDEYVRKNVVNGGREAELHDRRSRLGYLHTKQCIHRDVAARNCLYANKTVKISDFGLSREGDRYQMTCTSRLPIKWLSPETLNTGLYTQKSDVFSFGILVWEVFSNGSEPYKGMGNAEMLKFVLDGLRMEMPVDTPADVWELIVKRCWDGNPDTRWSMEQVARQLEKITGLAPPDKLKAADDLTRETRDATQEEASKTQDDRKSRKSKRSKRKKQRKDARTPKSPGRNK
ncbi:TK/FER protein kinase [Aphelenchoides avenae]|nr:TK/FER protein kinase [Aphelenchus avenae]